MMITETATGAVLANGGGKIKRSSFKSRGGPGSHSNGGGGSMRGYRAVRVTVPSTVVAELASKFNAVVVDADRGATARDIIKKVNKTLAKGAAVRATVEKFESAAEKKHGGTNGDHVVVVRTNSSGQSRAAAATAEQRSSATAAAVAAEQRSSASLVKLRMEQFQNGKKPQKPSVLGPKPKVTEATKRRGGEVRRTMLQKDSLAATADHRQLLNKHKRLSIARDPDAQLESVLNATPEQPLPTIAAGHDRDVPDRTETTVQERRTPSPPTIRPKPNRSFLHGRKGPETWPPTPQPSPITAEPVERPSDHVVHDEPAEPDPADPERDDQEPRSSFLHAYKTKPTADGVHDYNYIDGSGQQPQAIYEELLCDIQMSTARTEDAPDPSPLPDVVAECSYYDGANDHHYTTIDGGELNIYDDVVTAAVPENRKRPAASDEDGSYETVQAPPPPLPPAPQAAAVAAVPAADDDDHHQFGLSDKKSMASDNCSLEIDNSIYGLNPPSESTSSGKATVYIGNMHCLLIK